MRLKSKLLTAAASMVIAFSAMSSNTAFAASSYTQHNVFITTDGQVVDTFMDVPALYATYYAWSGPYSCATYASNFYQKHFGVSLYDVNSYKGRPHVYNPGHTSEFRDVDKPIPGDLVQALDYSHVAIVKEVDGDTITLIEQNWKWNDYSTGKPICTVNRKVGLKDNYYYRLYIDGVEQRLPQYQNAGGGSGSGSTVKPAAPNVKAALALSVTRDGFTVSTCATGTSLSSFRFGTYLKSKGASTAKWTTAPASGSTAYASSKVSVSDFGNAGGTYVTVVEITDAAGQKATKTVETIIDRTPPVISNVTVTNNTSAGYTVTCTVKDDGTVSSVYFPSWTTKNGKDDLPSDWSASSAYAGKISNGTATFTVNSADHGKQFGEYNTTIYAYDSFGNCATQNVTVNVAPEKIAKFSKSQYGLETGRSIMLDFILTDAAGNVFDVTPAWKSSDESIVTVSGGSVTALRPGKAVITASAAGKGASCTINVTENIEHAALEDIAPMTFNGSALTPSVKLTYGDKQLTEGTDYTVSFSNNTNVGHGLVTIRGTGLFSGARSAMFNILPDVKSIAASDGSADNDSADNAYIFSEHGPEIGNCANIISYGNTLEDYAESVKVAFLPDAERIKEVFKVPETVLVNSPLDLPKLVTGLPAQFAQMSDLSLNILLPRPAMPMITTTSVLHILDHAYLRMPDLIPMLV